MKKLILFSVLFILSYSQSNAQVTWEKLFSQKSTDVFRCVKEVPAGGYIVAGYTADSTVNDSDGYVVRLNTSGDTIWTFRYNGPLSKKDLFYKVINTSDGGFAVCGYSSSTVNGTDDVIWLKLSASGQQEWVKFWGGLGRDRGQDIIQTADGNYVIVGYTTSAPAQYYDAFIIRANTNGDTLWSKIYGGANYEDANCVRALSNGGYLLGGQASNGANGLDLYLNRVDTGGTSIWTKKWGTISTDNIEYIALLKNGFLVAGNTNTVATGDDGYIVKTDTTGTQVWAKTYGGSLADDFHRVDTTSDGGFVATGTTSSTGPALPNMWIMRTLSNGDSLWSKTFGGANHDHGYSGQQTVDGGYIIVGHSGSFDFNNENGYVVKMGDTGQVSNHLTYTTIFAIVNPVAGVCGSANVQVKAIIRNFGNEIVPNVPCTLNISGSLTLQIPFLYNGNFYPQDADTITFSTPINTSAGGTYTFNCYTTNNNDVYPANNSLTTTIVIEGNTGTPTVTNDSLCGNGSVSLLASSAGPVNWYDAPAGGNLVFTGQNYTTPVLTTTTTYYVQTGIICPSARVPIVAKIKTDAVDPVTIGDGRCGSGTLSLTATSTDPVTWYDAPTGGNIVGTGSPFITPSLSSTTTYYAQTANGSCVSDRFATIAAVNSVAADPVTAPQLLCGSDSAILIASSPDPIFWYDAASGGNLLGSGDTLVTAPISNTTTYYAQSDNGCLSNVVSEVVTVSAPASDPITNPGHNCGPGTVLLQATSSDPVAWYDTIAGGVALGNGPTFTTPFVSTTTPFYAEANNGTCPSARISVDAIILQLPNINLGNDTVIVGTTYLLDAGAGFPFYSWSTGESSQTINVNTTDTFCVTITDASNCSNSDCVFIDISDDIATTPNNNSFEVFPNPTTGSFSLTTSSVIKGEIEILNMTGAVVKRISVDQPASKININLSAFPKGIYVVRIKSEDYSAAKRVLIH